MRRWDVRDYVLAISLSCALLHFPSPASAQAPPLTKCDFYKVIGCTATGCSDITTKAWSIIDWAAKDYAYCDESSCQHATFETYAGGIYIGLTFPHHDLMFKLNLSDGSGVETSTILNTAVVSFGNCARNAEH
jgi:hypothetical protein